MFQNNHEIMISEEVMFQKKFVASRTTNTTCIENYHWNFLIRIFQLLNPGDKPPSNCDKMMFEEYEG